MTTRKTYQAIRSCMLTIYVTVKDKKRIPINFAHYNIEQNVKGRYSTSDPEIIEALEANKEFNSDFELISEEEIESKEDKEPSGNASTGKEGLTPIGGCEKVQLAKAYLVEKYQDKVTPSTLTTWKTVDAAAEELGIYFVR